jgi:hypothetical protein
MGSTIFAPPAQAPPPGPRSARLAGYPTAGHSAEYVTFALVYVRIVLTAEASFAAILDLIKFGIAIAAMIRMIATTIRSSIREKPFCRW